jgi:hypothetical protein
LKPPCHYAVDHGGHLAQSSLYRSWEDKRTKKIDPEKGLGRRIKSHDTLICSNLNFSF